MRSRYVALLCGSLATGCDAVPDLYVVDASIDATDPTDAGADDLADVVDTAQDAAEPDGCGSMSCPACAPSPGTCCDSGVACYGAYCATSCSGCAACAAGTQCCSKKNGKPGCRALDAGPCP